MHPNSSLLLIAFLVAGGLGGPAFAEDGPAAEPNDNARICEAYGPGYTVVPGTNTCIKINGFVRQDLNISIGGSGTVSPSSPPSQN